MFQMGVNILSLTKLMRMKIHVHAFMFTLFSVLLYRAVSTLCCGEEEELYVELRVRTVCELVINERYYLQPSITSLFSTDCQRTGKKCVGCYI